jgi:hypothetical protein
MPKIYGCGKGRIHREQQTIHDPDNPKPSMYLKAEKSKGARRDLCKEVLIVDMQTGKARKYGSFKEAADAIGCSPTLIGERIHKRTHGPIYERYIVATSAKEDE